MKISVVIPLYNKKDTFLRALYSVYSQTTLPEEIIVVNDGSTDGSEKIVSEFNHPLVKLVSQQNEGVSAARNRGIAEAKNEWVAFLDADDEWMPVFLEENKLLSTKYPQCSVLATSYFIQNYRGIRKKAILQRIPFSGDSGLLSNYFEVASSSHPPISSSSVVVRKEAMIAIGGFPAGINSGEDLITWAKLALNYQIAYSTNANAVFYLNESHELKSKPSRPHDKDDRVGKELMNLYANCSDNQKKYLKLYISHWYKMRASVYLRDRNMKGTWKYSFKSLKNNPFNYRLYAILLLSIMPGSIQKNILERF
jgi:glycosyltransferase involved in cell wall biosynthesis